MWLASPLVCQLTIQNKISTKSLDSIPGLCTVSPFAYWFSSEVQGWYTAGLILGLRPANERRRYKVTPYLIGWAQT